ncbi:facilitated trehalose transporter Tret1-2 homolog [Diachasma alloeum]|uniref:facilitated trehalose transporter Tret1-2 homolog n=1 Tax=Diachasma alloeum TaxID=454923 RepID=UPI00073812B5|nr:facilitated trehalose transporter Tret1-2 homolog [Diachasma alloeum]
MAPGSCEENESMLKYHQVNILKPSEILKDTEKCLERNNNITDDNHNNTDVYDDEEEIGPHYKSNCRGVLAQCMVSGAVLLLTAGLGMPIGFSAILLPQLNETNATVQVTPEIGSWIASIHSLASPLGALLSGPLLDAVGRRGSLQLATLPLILGWIMIGVANDTWSILTGRFLAGFSVGMGAVPSQVLIGECTDASLRGTLVTIGMVAYSGGILLVYALGATFRWSIVAFAGTVLPLVALVSLSFVCESPVWLMRRGKREDAKKALLWLRGGDEKQVKSEVSMLETRIQEVLECASITMTLSEKLSNAKATVFHPGVMKPLIVINVFFLLQVLSGTYLIVFYGVDLIRDVAGEEIDNYLAAVMTSLIRFVFCGLACILLFRVGRRTIGIVSALGTAVSSLALAGYILFNSGDSFISTYIVGVCLLLYVSFNTIGLMTLPGLLIGELLPQRARGIGGGFTMFVYNFGLFGVTKVFPVVKAMVGMAGVFGIFGISAILEGLFIWLALPETRNRTLEDIEDYFKDGNVLWIKRRRSQKQHLMNAEA